MARREHLQFRNTLHQCAVFALCRLYDKEWNVVVLPQTVKQSDGKRSLTRPGSAHDQHVLGQVFQREPNGVGRRRLQFANLDVPRIDEVLRIGPAGLTRFVDIQPCAHLVIAPWQAEEGSRFVRRNDKWESV